MAGGLLEVGEGYKNAAISGDIREAADKEKIGKANADLQAQGIEQTNSMVSSGVGAAASIGLMIAKVCA
jgi:hypothetical protein